MKVDEEHNLENTRPGELSYVFRDIFVLKEIKIGDVDFNIYLPRANDKGSTFREVFGSKNEYDFNVEILPRLSKEDIVLDCGAHIGLFSLQVSQYVNTVYSFEPDLTNYEYLNINLELNNLENIIPINKAVAHESEKREFFVSHRSPAINSLYRYDYFNKLGARATTREVDCTTLEDIFEEKGIEFCKLIKMDIEGAEFEVLLNLPDHMFKRIGMFILESHNWVTGYNEYDLMKKLRENGFETTMLFGSGRDKEEFSSLRSINRDMKKEMDNENS